jgi:hypothetical protein
VNMCATTRRNARKFTSFCLYLSRRLDVVARQPTQRGVVDRVEVEGHFILAANLRCHASIAIRSMQHTTTTVTTLMPSGASRCISLTASTVRVGRSDRHRLKRKPNLVRRVLKRKQHCSQLFSLQTSSAARCSKCAPRVSTCAQQAPRSYV